MLSYRHAFHAGNHADVLKHFVLLEVLRYCSRKDKPWWYIDTHAGAGCYALTGEQAEKTGEARLGIGRLWEREDVPEAFGPYLDAVRQFNPHGGLNFYPGSPALAMTQLRAQDRMRLFELHPADFELLAQTFSRDTDRVVLRKADGLACLRGLLPPPTRRAVVLIDPSYEVKQDYRQVVQVLEDAVRRFAEGIYMLWYPLLARPEARGLPDALRDLGADSWLDVRLAVRSPGRTGVPGMFGSGLFIINPPWVLPELLEAALPWLVDVLAEDDSAGFDLEHHIP
ncbi:MAG: 23S rRNA (adenine(2030)-N(6))-methyltransferase RlmJ [Zoogloeaceae bacterium]|nr:23S rRNA (adenine(2030)-N(6))-methyltransferase RlmJ [Zoogloeaceae bacterium]